MQRYALDLNRAAQGVARRSGNGRDDGQFVAGELVEQAGFPNVGLANENDLQATLQQAPLLRAIEHCQQSVTQPGQAAKGIGRLKEVDFLIGKIERRFGQRTQFGELIDKQMDFFGELTLQRAYGAAGSTRGGGVDKVGNRFSLGQIELAVLEGAAREFSGLGKPRAKFETARKQQLQNNRAAVTLQFQYVVAGEGMGSGEIEGEAAVDTAAFVVTKFCEGCVTRLWPLSDQGVSQ